MSTTTPEPTPVDVYPYELAGEPAEAPTEPTEAEVVEALLQLSAAQVTAGEVEPAELFEAASARLAASLVDLRAEANAANPNRDRSSDGWIGDAAHAARASSHNPNRYGVVCALDLDADGLNLPDAFERLRRRVAAGELPALRGGYLILNRRITRPDWSGWNVYTGTNPHTLHGHVNSSTDPARYDLRAAFGVFAGAAPAPAPAPAPVVPSVTLQRGSKGDRVRTLQDNLRRRFPAYRHAMPGALRGRLLAVDGDYGPATEAWVREYQRRAGLVVDGIAGPRTLGSLGLV